MLKGDAQIVIKGLIANDDNYTIAMELLDEKYDNVRTTIPTDPV